MLRGEHEDTKLEYDKTGGETGLEIKPAGDPDTDYHDRHAVY